ncbi:CRISPR-associated helicase Cas3' [Virgibacillus sp. M23]|uniref:CRISPR-associated helicase Cas3' n=1 Tax=Virgibacillus sp. M23 TaxID=3079030 RepID=UPI002A915BEF|nr:CRISPR-associated helicase Cas3' [Virgibacillus sp. M23]MDY7044782.1 CRISPR-associated helicase Cas3' [Virgibacillus sp. M23]
MKSVAHIRSNDKKVQTVEEHLIEVRNLAESYGEKIGVKHLAGLAGMLHDMGKYSEEFLRYITEAVENPDSSPKRGSVDHSSAGGKLLYELYHAGKNIDIHQALVAEIVGNAIISHHGYLHDFLNPDLSSDYLRRVCQKTFTENFEQVKQSFFAKVISKPNFQDYMNYAVEELKAYITKGNNEDLEKHLMFLTKFVFSTLIDADRTNTRRFEENTAYEKPINYKQLFTTYYEKLLKKIDSFRNHPDAHKPINVLRANMSDQCEQFATKSSGIYTLSIPTGGGKTLASLRYALKHAVTHNKKRIIYVVPFTTIIEQNAEEVRKVLQDNVNILEYHSDVIADITDEDEAEEGVMTDQQKLKLAKDNWDSPIIFTTMVQFLNVFYANGSRNIRRLHNLSDAIIIFDEVQKVPTKCVSLFNNALNYLNSNCMTSVLLCTATQPALDFVEHKLDINTDGEIIKDLQTVIDGFKRVEIIDQASDETFDNDKLSLFVQLKINDVKSILVILNTKTVVHNLYNQLQQELSDIPVYHLSTSMCAAHRKAILADVREKLDNGERIICISTQLIEAGVDVSFDCVIRSLAGLDSIAQAAGRCNRHGTKHIQPVYIIDHEEENLNHLKEIKIGKRISKKILLDIKQEKTNHGGNILSREAMVRYFQELFTNLAGDLNYFIPKLQKEMTELLMVQTEELVNAYFAKNGKLPDTYMLTSIKTAAENFEVIDNVTTSVIVPYEGGKNIITDLTGAETIDDLTHLLRTAQQYTINMYEHELRQLSENGGLVSIFDGEILTVTEGAYNNEYGLELQNNSDLSFLSY